MEVNLTSYVGICQNYLILKFQQLHLLESPWMNGITERHNTIIGGIIEKIREEINCSLGIAVGWSAKNALKMYIDSH